MKIISEIDLQNLDNFTEMKLQIAEIVAFEKFRTFEGTRERKLSLLPNFNLILTSVQTFNLDSKLSEYFIHVEEKAFQKLNLETV